MQTITAYRVETTRSYRMDEQGTGFSVRPHNVNTHHMDQTSEEIKVQIPDTAYLLADESLYEIGYEGRAYDLSEMIATGIAKVIKSA